MKSIGGYFELELHPGEEFHKEALRLNTGRNALEYILVAKGIKKLHVPYFACDVLLEPLIKHNIPYQFYRINEKLEPASGLPETAPDEYVLYINYFGLKDVYIESLASRNLNLIIDNSQAFFSLPLPGRDTFYSARKYVGVPDGAYLYTDKLLDSPLQKDQSWHRFGHLLKRRDLTAEAGYGAFCENDASLVNEAIKSMSSLTRDILSSLDYNFIISKRRSNFTILKESLEGLNLLNFEMGEGVPMAYPFRTHNKHLKEKLHNNKIYTATYWPNVREWAENESFERALVNEVIYLPIDQRYNETHMQKIIKIITV